MLFLNKSITSENLRDSPLKNHFRFQVQLLDETITIEVAIGNADPEVGINRPYVADWAFIGSGENWLKGERAFESLCEDALKVYLRDCLVGDD